MNWMDRCMEDTGMKGKAMRARLTHTHKLFFIRPPHFWPVFGRTNAEGVRNSDNGLGPLHSTCEVSMMGCGRLIWGNCSRAHVMYARVNLS